MNASTDSIRCFPADPHTVGQAARILVALLGLLLAGLMVGRTQEYLGKTIGPPEAKILTLYVLACGDFSVMDAAT
ncbi:MAG: potassium-transporting ATPase subunit KdpA [Acidobacteriia bacterium]|nr:potassium-transporting ATPase subunit KdpA [Terriglobia bacterium]